MFSLKKTALIIFILLFFASVVLNGIFMYKIYQDNQVFEQSRRDDRIMDFRNMFTEQVLLASREIDFDTRLALETAVRSLTDSEILSGWQEFTRSETKEEATASAKNLLKLLIKKTSK
ncbi:MAG: hypothetical protein ABIJ84_04680 [bacterium]